MKFLHLGDLHLGKTLGEFDLIPDQNHILEQILTLAVREKADAVLVAGDVYDKAIPSEAAVRLLDLFLNRLAKAGIAVFLISGNHDSDDRLAFGSSLFTSNRIYISSVFDGTLHRHTLADACGEVDFYLMPFVKASQVRHFFPEEEINTYEDAVRTILAHAKVDPSRRNVLLAHQFVAGRGEDPFLSGSEGAMAQSVGLVEKIGYNLFSDFDYVALGHIHAPQRVGRDEVRYAGSPLKYSLSECSNQKSVPVVTLLQKGRVDIRLKELVPLRDLRHLTGPLKELMARANQGESQDFIYATLTDEEETDQVIQIIRQVYPNTVRIEYDNAHTRSVQQVDISRIAANRSFEELVSDFYTKMYGCDISEEEMRVLQQVAKEAGVIQ